jgi:hypothetical protein
MKTYTVFEPPASSGASVEQRLEAAVLVKDGFAWPAFLLPPLWLAWHRMWMALAIYVATLLLAAGLVWLLGLGDAAMTVIVLGAALVLGLEGNELRRSVLTARGYAETGIVTGASLEDCELRHFGGTPTATGPA